MDVYHPKDQHMHTHIETLGHWNTLTLSLLEVTWSLRVNIFTRNIGYIGPIMQNSTMSTFLHIGLSYTTGSKPKVRGKSILTLTLGQMKGGN